MHVEYFKISSGAGRKDIRHMDRRVDVRNIGDINQGDETADR